MKKILMLFLLTVMVSTVIGKDVSLEELGEINDLAMNLHTALQQDDQIASTNAAASLYAKIKNKPSRKVDDFLSTLLKNTSGKDIINNLLLHPALSSQLAYTLNRYKPKIARKALFRAVKKGNISLTQKLIDAGVDVNAYNKERDTLLKKAIIRNYPTMVQLLIDKGANLDGSATSEPPLITAIKEGNKNIVKQLVDNGANPNTSYRDISVISWAKTLGNKDIVAIIQKAISGK
jgi:ankyrin repeat protein